MGGLLTHPLDNTALDGISMARDMVFNKGRQEVTLEMLVALSRVQTRSRIVAGDIEHLAERKFNISHDELCSQEVDIEAVKKSLNLDQWPDSVLPKE
jgi:hypothetical protein